MFLYLNDFESIAFGFSEIVEENEYYIFHRMTKTEQAVYKNDNDLLRKTYATAGIKFDFYTDADNLSFKYKMKRASSRKSSFLDIYIDEVFVESVGDINADEFICGEYSRPLNKGEKRITIYFSNLYNLQFKQFELLNASFIKSHNYDMKVLSYGDSITQGYDAIFPSFSYINQLSTKLNAVVYNKAIGADVFRPDLIEKVNFKPDIITVAYGTNDWCHYPKEEVNENMDNFFKKLTAIYNNTRIFVITPIWRKDCENITAYGKFIEIVAEIETQCKKYGCIELIKGEELLPHTDLLFSDGYLHPNELGMCIYAQNLYQKIKEKI